MPFLLGPLEALAAIYAAPVVRREEQGRKLLLHLAGDLVRTISKRLARATGTNVRMGEPRIVAGVIVDRGIKERVAKEVSVSVKIMSMTIFL